MFTKNSKLKFDPFYLVVTDSMGEISNVELIKDASFFVGSSPNCRIFLNEEDVQPLHCRIWLDEKGDLQVQDWNTNFLTLVNGQAIEEITRLNSGDELRVGSCLIVPVLSADLNAQLASNLNLCDIKHAVAASDPIPESPTFEISGDVHSSGVSTGEIADTPQSLPSDSQDTNTRFEYDFDADVESSSGYEFEVQGSLETESANQELECLRCEVEQLRYEVAERDSQIQMLNGREPNHDIFDGDDDETTRLVNRLEELLEELEAADGRTHGLVELLRVSDQATQAEQEERLQLERWVREIEHRVGQREAEDEAERNRILSRLKDMQARYEFSESQLKRFIQDKDNGVPNSSNEQLRILAETVTELSEQLATAKETNEALRQQNSHNVKTAGALEELQQLEQKLLQTQVDASRERAELARDRAQLERLKDEFQQKLNQNRNFGEAETRIRAMRQHLQDIHEQDKQERENKKQFSLGGRISSLLSRVGR